MDYDDVEKKNVGDPYKVSEDGDAGAAPEEDLTLCEVLKEELPMLKYKVLVICCFLTFGSYYIYDFPGSIGTGKHHTIQHKFQKHGKEFTQEMNQALYSVYSWPNTVLAVFGGLLIDKFLGLRKATILFVTLVTIGAGVFTIGVLAVNYPLLIVARIIFGLGGESLSVAQSALIARWFMRGRGMALAFGITVSFARVGSSFNFLLSPKFAESISIDFACLMGLAACGISLLSGFALAAIDYYGEKKGLVPAESKEAGEPFRCSQAKEISVVVWVICAICVTAYCCLFPFVGVAKNFFEVKYNITGTEASDYVSIFQFTCAGGSPIVGGLVDNTGRFIYWMAAATTMFILEHILFIVTMIPPYVMMPALGVFYSFLVSSLWPAVPYAVDETIVGIAYGIMTALQNAGLAVSPLIVGGILTYYTPAAPNSTAVKPNNGTNNGTDFSFDSYLGDGSFYLPSEDVYATSTPTPHHASNETVTMLPLWQGFVYTEIFFICVASSGLLLCILLYFLDKKYECGVLGAAPAKRKEIMKEVKAERDAAKQKLLEE